MYHFQRRRNGTTSLLDRYSERMGVIVDRNLAEQALVAARQNAEQLAKTAHAAMLEAQAADRAKTEFLANVSHELRTPLNAIIGFSDFMMSGVLGPDNADKHEEYTRDINDSGRHLLGLINDILDVSKIEAGQLDLDCEAFVVEDIMSSCATLIDKRVKEGGLRLSVVSPAAPITIFADKRKLKQIVLNLLSNAVKFTPADGEVVLSWSVDEESALCIRVFDTGIGIPPDQIDRAMEPFIQIDNYLCKTYEGTGLGLPLSRALTELHGGTFSIESAVGVGTVGTVRLPPERVGDGRMAIPPVEAVEPEDKLATKGTSAQ